MDGQNGSPTGTAPGIPPLEARPDAAHADARALAIDALLPQTQCGQCGYRGCLPYARALANGSAEINRCPPGGDDGILALARLLDRPVLPLDAGCGQHRVLHVAQIDESRCIGCTLCIQACPVDAIAGAIKRMHTVLPGACTGCDLCLPPCPMDCIRMVPADPARDWTRADADRARTRMQARNVRRAREQAQDDERLAAKALRKRDALAEPGDLAEVEIARRRAIIERALERVRQRREAAGTPATGDGTATRGDPA